jgi:hypothetical protein
MHDWSRPITGLETLARAEQAREQAAELRHDTIVLRGAMAWTTRRLRRTRRLALDPPRLVWLDGPDGLDDVLV